MEDSLLEYIKDFVKTEDNLIRKEGTRKQIDKNKLRSELSDIPLRMDGLKLKKKTLEDKEYYVYPGNVNGEDPNLKKFKVIVGDFEYDVNAHVESFIYSDPEFRLIEYKLSYKYVETRRIEEGLGGIYLPNWDLTIPKPLYDDILEVYKMERELIFLLSRVRILNLILKS